MADNTNPTIFLSYSWKNVLVADEIDNDFKSIGITFRRDVRDAPYRTSIKEFMQQVGKTDFVLMIISDEYLRSENCMHEVTELLNTHEFSKRILPIVLDNVRSIFKAADRATYYDYWKDKLKEAQKLKRKHPNQDYIEHEKKYSNINNHLDSFFALITDLNVSTYENLKKENYRPLLNIAGFEDENLLLTLLFIDKIENEEEHQLALEEFLNKYPTNRNALFRKAYESEKNKQYIKAKKYYKDLLEKHPLYVNAHINLGGVFVKHFNDAESAKKHIEEALRIDPKNAVAHYNLGLLLIHNFPDYKKAKESLEQALVLDPEYAMAHNNLGLLLASHFDDFFGARKHFEEVLRIDQKHLNAHNNLGLLLTSHLNDHIGARKYYQKALQIDKEYFIVHNNLGMLLTIQFDNHNEALKHYNEALRINPNYGGAHLNLSLLLKRHFPDNQNAKQHYLTAITLDPSLKTKETDELFL